MIKFSQGKHYQAWERLAFPTQPRVGLTKRQTRQSAYEEIGAYESLKLEWKGANEGQNKTIDPKKFAPWSGPDSAKFL